jgi:ADP-ribose pyrophosphatase
VPRPRAKILSSKLIYQGKVFGVRQERIIEPGGVEVARDIVTHSGSVVLLPVLADGRILMIRQYRHTVGDFLLELAAGRMEKGESPVKAAHRELAEETGYRAKRLRRMMYVFPTPGFVREPMIAFAATGLTLGKTNPDEDERIELRPYTLKTLLQMIRRGRIHDMKSVAGILYYSRFMSKSSK